MKYKFEIKWGVIFTVLSILWMIFEKWMGWHGPKIAVHALYTNFFAIVAILIYIFAFLDKRKNDKSIMQWKHGFFYGLGIAIVVAVLSPLSQWITSFAISPDYFSNAIAYSVEQGKLTQQQANDYFNLKNYLIQGFVGALIMGTITSAIIALFIQKKHPEYLG